MFLSMCARAHDPPQGSWIPEADEVLQGRLGEASIEVHVQLTSSAVEVVPHSKRNKVI